MNASGSLPRPAPPNGPNPLQKRWKEHATKLSHSANAELNLSRARQAPIRELSKEEFFAVLAKLWNDVHENWLPVKKRAELPKSFSPADIKEWARNLLMKKQWNQRIEQILSILGEISKEDLKNTHRMCYFVDDEPVGALLLRPGSPPYVAILVVHAGSEQAGGALMEYAVNQSKIFKSGGKLALFAEYDNAMKAYEAMGLVSSPQGRHGSPRYMTLDPNTSPRWTQDGEGNFKLAKYSEKEYLG